MAAPKRRWTGRAAAALLLLASLVPAGCATGRGDYGPSSSGSEGLPLAAKVVLFPFLLAFYLLVDGDDGCEPSWGDSDGCCEDDGPRIVQTVRRRR